MKACWFNSRLSATAVLLAAVFLGGIPCSVSSGQAAFVPTPDGAHLCLATENWLLWETKAVVPGTEMNRAQTLAYQYLLQSNLHSPATPIFNCSDTRPPETVGILANGTAVFSFISFSADLVLVDRQGRQARINCREPQQSSVEYDRPLAAFDDGVLVRPNTLNQRSPAFFVPWKVPPHDLTQPVVLDFSNKIMVTDTNGVNHRSGRDLFHREGDTFVWAWEDYSSCHLSYFDLSTGTRKIHPNSHEATPIALQATDGETVVLAVGSPGRGQCSAGFDIRTGERLPAWLPNAYTEVAVKRRVAYALAPSYDNLKRDYDYALVACDLTVADAKPKVLLESKSVQPSSVVCVVRKDALTIWWDHQWKRIEWQ